MNLPKVASALCLSLLVGGCASEGGNSFFVDLFKPSSIPANSTKIDVKATQKWMDKYEPGLRKAAKDSDLRVERRDNVLVVTAPVDPCFNVKRRPAMLMPKTLRPLTNIAKLVEHDPATAVLVIGHADSTGPEDLNRKLSLKRAQAVGAIFHMSGLNNDRLMLRGFGSDFPVAANDSSQGRALNRRVEIILTPKPTLIALINRYRHPNVALAQSKVKK